MTAAGKRKLEEALWWLAPVVFLFWLYQDGLKCWFIGDDFAWLGLLRQYREGESLVHILFSPAAQGTIRPWSERGFFLLFEYLFGLDSLPFRLMTFITMGANLVLIAWITRRIAQSRVAGLVAAVCWAANAALMTVMTWSSAYNQALCAFFLLAAMGLFILFAETGKWRFWWFQTVVFTLGFGALELNVVYPALAGSWVLFVAPPERRRSLLGALLPLAGLSVAYFFVHRAVAPLPATGVYSLQWDHRIFRTVARYISWAGLPQNWRAWGHSRITGFLIAGWCITALGVLAVAEIRRRRRVALFFIAWFFITLAPILPLPLHRTEYYLTIPLIGLGMLAGWSVGCSWRGAEPDRRWQAAAVATVLVYLAGMIPVARSATRWSLDKTRPVRALVLGVKAAKAAHPDKSILLEGVTSELYTDSVGQGAFNPLGINDVYLTPESRPNLSSGPDLLDPDIAVLEPAAALHALDANEVVVYSLSGDHLRNVTDAYGRSAPNRFTDRLPPRADIGNPLYSWLLGPRWLPPLSGVRWMPGTAALRLKGPQPGNKLVLDGYCPAEYLKRAPRHLTVSVDAVALGETQINDPETSFHRLFPLPDAVVGRQSVDIEIRVSPVVSSDGQDYGVLFGKVGFQQ